MPPNSDSKQCPESRLDWVHTLNPAARRLRPGRARWAPCRGAPGAVSQASPDRIVAFLSAMSQACPAVSSLARRVVAALPSPPVTIQNFIVTQVPAARRVARSAARVAAPLHRVAVCWAPCRRALGAVSRHKAAPNHDTMFVS